MNPLDGFSVSTLFGGWHASGLRPRNLRETFRPHPSLFPLTLFPQRFEYFLRRNRHLVDSDPDGVVDSIRDRGHHRQQWSLADFLRAERSVGVGILDQVGDDVAHL